MIADLEFRVRQLTIVRMTHMPVQVARENAFLAGATEVTSGAGEPNTPIRFSIFCYGDHTLTECQGQEKDQITELGWQRPHKENIDRTVCTVTLCSVHHKYQCWLAVGKEVSIYTELYSYILNQQTDKLTGEPQSSKSLSKL